MERDAASVRVSGARDRPTVTNLRRSISRRAPLVLSEQSRKDRPIAQRITDEDMTGSSKQDVVRLKVAIDFEHGVEVP